MSELTLKDEFWNQVYFLALQVGDLAQMDQPDFMAVIAGMENIDLGFAKCFDPVDAYPEYAAWVLCHNLQKLLHDQSCPGVRR